MKTLIFFSLLISLGAVTAGSRLEDLTKENQNISGKAHDEFIISILKDAISAKWKRDLAFPTTFKEILVFAKGLSPEDIKALEGVISIKTTSNSCSVKFISPWTGYGYGFGSSVFH